MTTLTKRAFIGKVFAALIGVVVAVPVLSGQVAKRRPLRASVKEANPSARAGVRRRLARIQVFSVEEAFRLANRKTEIEITTL